MPLKQYPVIYTQLSASLRTIIIYKELFYGNENMIVNDIDCC